MVQPDFQTKDDVYCFSLAKALYYVTTPVTVGFYAPWGRRTDILLSKVESYLRAESWKKEQDEIKRTGLRTRTCSGKDLLKLLFLMIFHHPVITERHKERQNIQYVFIRFSAWEFAGSDHLWAGLVTTLCDGIENCFGLAPISLYRVVCKKTKIIIRDDPRKQEWVSKRFLCIPLWLATIMVIMLGIGVGALILIFGFPIGDASGDMLTAFEGVGATVVGISAAGVLRAAVLVIKNTIITQKGKVEQKMNRTDMSSQLGFMSDVKREVRLITRYIQLIEIFQRRKIRIVLEITNLDKCLPDKIVGVLNAMNILLSDPNAPFISVLSVDPSIIIDCVENSELLKGVGNNGYRFLNRIITLPFSIPKMDCDSKLFLIRQIIQGKEALTGDMEEEGDIIQVTSQIPNEKEQLLRLRSLNGSSDIPLMVTSHERSGQPTGMSNKLPKTKDLIAQAFQYLFHDTLKDYITDNVIHIRRMVNTITITIRLMIRSVPRNIIKPQKVTEWVLLATQWPCRLSWILQCIEDEQQKMSLEQNGAHIQAYFELLLWDVYEKSLEELDAIKMNITHLLDLDGDPELFHKLIKDNFTVSEANFFLPFTNNLDYSMKRQMELLRGSNNLWEAKKTRRLTTMSLLNMSVEDVCIEMNKLGFKKKNLQKYQGSIKTHNLNGRALVYSDNNEIKEALCMGLGDWTLFSVYFLGVMPPPAGPTFSAAASTIQNPLSCPGSRENILRASRPTLYHPKDELDNLDIS
ncbi:NTPase KAP family P-loop domain-containing protein 1 [Xenopus laevis]|uniref:NTPase KAP family P-loop domain-containing protein 1 n=2 Tax=Xenopus laevis TaxID=8355 RepID=A0A8J1LGS8_XENLA|nr:NTPase KAP family P-loop domain-containing protein 1 [Xenopus laevis]